mmetsp:Transcript_32366/g.47193  ORF Transcript_32366/g.47193 Transcript_32366/m.47193 type:complete len:216 (-) Transcript_32366:104-751(-)
MDNISTEVDPSEIPEGFTTAAGNGAAGGAAAEKQSEAQQRQAQRDAILEQALTPDALARLRRIKLVKAEKATSVETSIVSMAMQGKLQMKISEGKLIEMLEGTVAKQKSSGAINIQRKKYAFDSDDDDDDDDDDTEKKPMDVDLAQVAKVFPYGRLLPIEVVVGGLKFSTGRIVNELGDVDDLAVCVAASVSIGYDDRTSSEGSTHKTYSTKDGF